MLTESPFDSHVNPVDMLSTLWHRKQKLMNGANIVNFLAKQGSICRKSKKQIKKVPNVVVLFSVVDVLEDLLQENVSLQYIL